MNKIFFTGFFGKKPALQKLGETSVKCSFSLSHKVSYRNQQDILVEETEWIDFEVWGKKAETICQYFDKGSKIEIEGEIRKSTWMDEQTQENRSRQYVRVIDFEFSSKKGTQSNASQQPAQAASAQQPAQAASAQQPAQAASVAQPNQTTQLEPTPVAPAKGRFG